MMLIGESIQWHAKEQNSKLAIICEETSVTYGALHQNIQLLQSGLFLKVGNLSGKKIMFLVKNNVEFITLFLAASLSGAVAVPIDPKWSDREKKFVIEDCAPDLIIFDKDYVISSGYETCLLKDLYQEQKIAQISSIPPSDALFYIGYTSGTTGAPKGYMRSHRSWIESFARSSEAFNLSEEDHIFSPGPLVHSHFLYAAIHALHLGSTLYMTTKFMAESVCKRLLDSPVTVLYVVPTMMVALHTYMAETGSCCSKVKKIISAGAKWQPLFKEETRKWFKDVEIIEFYGASELSFVSFLDESGYQAYPDSVGRAFPGVNISIRNEVGKEVEPGEAGKLFVNSSLLFQGYLNNEAATREVFDGAWASVGDIATMNESGYITLVGRENNKMITGGLNVYPEEIEKVLLQIPQIEEALVIGVEDDYWGEKVIALIRWKHLEHKLTDYDLKSYCIKHLSSYKCPRIFLEQEAFPYTTSGKIARKQVKQHINQLLKR